ALGLWRTNCHSPAVVPAAHSRGGPALPDTTAPAHEDPRRPGKAVRVLVRDPELRILDADLWAVSSLDISLVLDEPLAGGTIVAVITRYAALSGSPSRSARVAYAAPIGRRGWFVRCRFSSPLCARELKALID